MDFFVRLSAFAGRIVTSPWFWLALLATAVCWILVILYRQAKLRALDKISYNRHFSTDGIFVGETLELVETIHNPSWFPLFRVRVEFFMPGGLTVDNIECRQHTKVTSIFHIPPHSTTQKTHKVRADKREHFRMHTSFVRYRDIEYTFDSHIDFYAYPNQYDADASFAPDVYHAGEMVASRKYIEDPFFLSGIRAYRPGDPMRSINFKASARGFSGGMRQLMSNDYDSSRNYNSMILLDLTSYSEALMNVDAQIEIGLRYACYIFCEALRNGGNVGFATNCAVDDARYIHIPCSSGTVHTKLILEQFAEISSNAKRDYSVNVILQTIVPELARGTDIYLITPHVDEKMAGLLHSLQRSGRNVEIILLSGGDRR
jgi:uncharacterized protein (DUF58 family)